MPFALVASSPDRVAVLAVLFPCSPIAPAVRSLPGMFHFVPLSLGSMLWSQKKMAIKMVKVLKIGAVVTKQNKTEVIGFIVANIFGQKFGKIAPLHRYINTSRIIQQFSFFYSQILSFTYLFLICFFKETAF
jgi:hypothetical protein